MKKLSELLLMLLGEKLKPHEFKLKKSDRAFRKKYSGGVFSFHLAFIHHVGDFDVVADFAIRFDELENLLDTHDVYRNEQYKGKLFTIGIELGNHLGIHQKRWRVNSEVDVFAAADALYQVFVTYALPYFDKYSDLQNAYDLIADNRNKMAQLNNTFSSSRCINHVGMAMLLGFNKSHIDKIIEEDTRYLDSFDNKYDLKRFLDFVEKAKQLPEWR